jgi:enediyne polyketide synthase
MIESIALVGMACRYPDARSPQELWENALAQRRAFRRLPPERVRLEDYYAADPHAPDRTYATEAAVLEDYTFDRVRFRVAGSTFQAADSAHWLALELAAQALEDAGFPDGSGLPRKMTGVLLGNTLTGEFSRANVLRLRWPYVRRVTEAALIAEGWAADKRQVFLDRLETEYKAPFPPVGEETLAGGLANTIAGRICNYFDLKGGGYTVDGACASSLLSIANACSALAAGDLDVAIAGGVDLSLDPFELVGFAKIGALAPEQMRVYDARSGGFWPGEGCGMVVLMRREDALAQQRRIYALLRGWGISSDGRGGITRPEVEGQLLALERAYRRAGFGMETVAYFEGHGTGTAVGDAVELQTLSQARRKAAPETLPAAIGTIKANIGHTKAAAGVAGLIKAVQAVHNQVLPPTTGCEQPHPELRGKHPALRVLPRGELWPDHCPLRAGVSAMGFGGINTHVVLEGVATERRRALSAAEGALLSSAQDAELFLLAAADPADLRSRVAQLRTVAAWLSRGQLGDLAATLALTHTEGALRAAVVASTPAELESRMEVLHTWLEEDIRTRLDLQAGVFLNACSSTPRLGFLFPGQSAPAHLSGGIWSQRFDAVRILYAQAELPEGVDGVDTHVAQPAIVTASRAALRILQRLGIVADLAIGHSLGEFTALHWAGVLDEDALGRIARARGQAMAEQARERGAMASLGAGPEAVEALLGGCAVQIAGYNSPCQTVVSGDAAAVEVVCARARARNLQATRLPVSHAFHSPLVAAAVPALAAALARETLHTPCRRVLSTVTGAELTPGEDVPALLCRQVTSPVRFVQAFTAIADDVELWIEAGPGTILGGLAREMSDKPVVSVDAGGRSLRGLLCAAGAAYTLGTPLEGGALFADRFTRPFDIDRRPRFLANPCESAPLPSTKEQGQGTEENPSFPPIQGSETRASQGQRTEPDSPLSALSPLDIVRQLVMERTELPVEAVKEGDRLLSDLHMNSISVGQVIAEAARRLGLPPPVALLDYADATLAEAARALEESARTGSAGPSEESDRFPAGIAAWVRAFTVERVARPRRSRPPGVTAGAWQVLSPPEHAFAAAVREAFASAPGGGVALCLPPNPDERHVPLLIESARAVLASPEPRRYTLVQHGGGGEAFAKTLHLEHPEIAVCVADVPLDHPEAASWIVAEALDARGYTEAHYDGDGRRYEPVLRQLPLTAAEENPPMPLGSRDVLLVTGGGKGIAAECALALARQTGVQLLLMGRSRPNRDAELAANLARMEAAGVRARYVVADVTDADAVRAGIREAEAAVGPVTALLHGAGLNVPRLLRDLEVEAFQSTLATKLSGARNVLASLDPARLRLVIAFGSVIARTGFHGEADYAVANAWLARLVEDWQRAHSHCRCLTLEWSVWSGAGMAERLGRVEALARQGITPISLEEGMRQFCRLLAQPALPTSVVVTGRYGDAPTLAVEAADLPFQRFLERPRVHYPGIELVVDVELSTESDPYLDDHIFRGERLVPGVMALEAAAQVAMALAETSNPPRFEDVRFLRPIVVPEGQRLTVRVAALQHAPNVVEVALRCAATAFQADHFQATCRFDGDRCAAGSCLRRDRNGKHAVTRVPLQPERDLYGSLLFHSGRFRRLQGYRRLRATECVADSGSWFGAYLPATLALQDPGARDAAIHAIQACIPQATLLPIGIDRLTMEASLNGGPYLVQACERARDGDLFVYDLILCKADGTVCERWEGLRLRRVEDRPRDEAWALPLLGPYLERKIAELVPGTIAAIAAVRMVEGERQVRSVKALQQALGRPVSLWRRPDGKPALSEGPAVSTAHAGELTLAIAGPEPLGCDVEAVVVRSAEVWRDLLGADRFRLAETIARECAEELSVSATRAWTAGECLKKADQTGGTPLVLDSSASDGWVRLSSGALTIGTYAGSVCGGPDRLVFAILVRRAHASL